MTPKLLKRLLSQLSIKWKKLDAIGIESREELDWLLEHGLIEGGVDVFLYGMNCNESEFSLYLISGRDWHENVNMQALSDTAIRDKEIAVQTGSIYAYFRLTQKGVEDQRAGRTDSEPIPFRCEQVEYFEEQLTDDELSRLEEDQKQIWPYMKTNVKHEFQKTNLSDLKFYVTRDAIKYRVTSKEYARLGQVTEHVVVGQEHEAIQRDLIAALWPDLAEQIELEGSIAAYSQASHRLQNWTGIRMPHCHRDWRALSEWAGLKPDEITEDWLDEFLVPRLRVLWLKESSFGTDQTLTEDREPPENKAPDSSPAFFPASAAPPAEFCKNDHPIGPLTGNRTELGFALHDEDDLSDVTYRSLLSKKFANGVVWVRESTHSRKLEMFVRSFKVRDLCQNRLNLFAELK